MRLLLLLAVLVGALSTVPAAAQRENHAAVVVDFGDGRVEVRVVAFEGDSISGVDLLQRSGLDVALMSGLGGTAVCAIEGVGCPPTPQECFCRCRGTPCRYWSYFHLQGGDWTYAPVGAAQRRLGDGDVDGWIWGDGQTPPPSLTWDQIWAMAAPSAPTPAPTAAPTAPSAPTPAPAAAPTAASTATAASTVASTATRPSSPSPLSPQPSTPDLQPATVNPQPSTPNLQPATVNPQPSTVNLEPATVNPEPSTLNRPGLGGGIYSALGFAGLVAVLLALGLWVRRRR